MKRTWFITGINSGFGREMAEQLLRRGDRVAGTIRRPSAVADLESAYGASLWTAHLDLAHTDTIEPVVAQAFAELGKIDVIVNNAGYGLFGPAEGLTDSQIRHQIDTNLIGPIQVTRTALPFLRAQKGGRIIVMSTYGGQATHPGASLYHASKWGLEGFFDSLAGEVAAFDIGVTIIEPGASRTAFRSTAGDQMGNVPSAYQDTPIGGMRAYLANPSYRAAGDPAKMVRIIVDSVEQSPAPKRIALGRDAFAMIQQALTERLSGLEAQKELASSTDIPIDAAG